MDAINILEEIIDFKNKELKEHETKYKKAEVERLKFVEIRLLPMSVAFEFPDMDYKEIQNQFFLNDLIYQKKGEYLFRKYGMNAEEGSLVLFQIDNKIIASANLIKVDKFKKVKYKLYKGAYYFDVDTIKVFEPITANELYEIDSNFKRFSQVKQHIDSSKHELIMDLINSKEQVKLPEEVDDDSKQLYEGIRKQIFVNAYERNSKAKAECIKIYGPKCAICGFDFGKVYGRKFEGKIHVHHIKPLNEIDKEYAVNPEKDLIPVCPNCHFILHSKVGGTYTAEEVRKFI